MLIRLISPKLSLPTSTHQFINQKLTRKLDQYLSDFREDIKTATLTVKQSRSWLYTLNFDMNLPKKSRIFASASGKDLHATLIVLREKITRQLTRYRHKLTAKKFSRLPPKSDTPALGSV